MDREIRLILRLAMMRYKGDDLERAEIAFDGADLDIEHGSSGRSRRQVLEEYRQDRDVWQRAYDWLVAS